MTPSRNSGKLVLKISRELVGARSQAAFQARQVFWFCSAFSVMGRGQIRGFCWWQGPCGLFTRTLLRMKVDTVNRRSGHGVCASDPWLVWSSSFLLRWGEGREWWMGTFRSHLLSPRQTASSPGSRCSVCAS